MGGGRTTEGHSQYRCNGVTRHSALPLLTRQPASERVGGLFAAVFGRSASPLLMAVDAGIVYRLGELDHLVPIFRLGRRIGLQTGVTELLHEHRPDRVGDRSGRTVRT